MAKEKVINPYTKRKYQRKEKTVSEKTPATVIGNKTHGTRSKSAAESVIVSPEKGKSVEETAK